MPINLCAQSWARLEECPPCFNIFWLREWKPTVGSFTSLPPVIHPFFSTTTCLFLRLCPLNCWLRSSSFPGSAVVFFHTFRSLSNGSADCFPIHVDTFSKVYIDCLYIFILDLLHRKATSVKDKCCKDLNRKSEYATSWADDQKMFVWKTCLAERSIGAKQLKRISSIEMNQIFDPNQN